MWESNQDDVVFTAIDDARSFMACLTRLLLGGIRRVPEQKTKGESSKGMVASDCATSRRSLIDALYSIDG